MDQPYDPRFAKLRLPLLSAPFIPGRVMVGAIGASVMVVAALLIHIDLMIDPAVPRFWTLSAWFVGLAVLRWLLRDAVGGGAEKLRDFAEYVLTFMGISLLGVLASYALAGSSQGFVDAELYHADRMLHFDWLALYHLVAASPLLQHLGQAAYSNIYITPAILFLSMAWHGEKASARHFLLTYWVAVVMTLLVFPLMPAKGALDFLTDGPVPYMPTSGRWQGLIIPELRAHSILKIDLGALQGLVCAPSFHTVSAVLYLAWAWKSPRLRWLLVPVNIAMLMATPIEGVHYLSDMILGAGVALLAIAAVNTWLRRQATLPGKLLATA
ncbi:phosphatase PAP2 family protein [Novosphingobium sp.]|uniref:phosphatase PAP2 family protein n=1 Tax=Novosphingobium sp. TaxID=1874826 RepID=UPI0031D74FFB